jgi:hypothetical protein
MIINPYIFNSYNYLLDIYTSSQVAFSMFKLRNAYAGSCLRVRRSSDNTEQDIGFVNNYLDTASLLSFVGSGNGYIVRFYDQSGSNNLTQTTASNQPQIVSTGTLITRNGIAVFKASSTQWLSFTSTITINTAHNWWMTYEKDTTSNHMVLYGSVSAYAFYEVGTSKYTSNTLFVTASPNLVANDFMLLNSNYWIGLSNVCNLYRNGTQIGTGLQPYTPGTTQSQINTIPGSAFRNSTTAYINEFVLFNADKWSDRANIELNIKSRNSIY